MAASAFEAIGFAFREQATSDFGIDAHVEPRTIDGGTGRIIALQIKSGSSYLREESCAGWWLRTDRRHADYWLRHALPVVIVQVDIEARRVYWQSVTERTLQATGKDFKILIPRDHRVDVANRAALLGLLEDRAVGELAAEAAGCHVLLGRGVSGRRGWHAFARVLVRELETRGVAEWDIVVEVRTSNEDDDLTEANEFGSDGADLVTIVVDPEKRRATYRVSSREVDDMDLLWDKNAAAAADTIIQYLLAADGMLDEDIDGYQK